MPKDSNDEITRHYDKKQQISLRDRQNSPIIRLKNFNNWIKSILIGEHVKPGAKVLDLCCGKGGDLLKWKKAEIASATFADISTVSIEQCRERYTDLDANFQAQFLALDCFSPEFEEELHTEKGTFDIVSCQFAYHYSFATKASLLNSLKIVSSLLVKGGTFLITIPDAQTIYRRLMRAPGMEFGNSIYRVRFLGDSEKVNFVKYGEKYEFWLRDAIDNCPEYMVHADTLKDNAKAFGLRCLYWKNFGGVWEEFREKYSGLLCRMRRRGSEREREILNTEEWEVASLYLAAVFVKE